MLDVVLTPHPRFGRDRWPERLTGRAVEAIEAREHLLLRRPSSTPRPGGRNRTT